MRLTTPERESLLEQLLASYKPTPLVPPVYALPPEGPYDCQACGACCIEAGTVPVYADETQVPEDRLSAYPTHLRHPVPPGTRQVAKHLGGRCRALEGEIGACTRCTIYAARPRVCAAFAPGTDACKDSRLRASRKMADLAMKPRGYGPDWQTTVMADHV